MGLTCRIPPQSSPSKESPLLPPIKLNLRVPWACSWMGLLGPGLWGRGGGVRVRGSQKKSILEYGISRILKSLVHTAPYRQLGSVSLLLHMYLRGGAEHQGGTQLNPGWLKRIKRHVKCPLHPSTLSPGLPPGERSWEILGKPNSCTLKTTGQLMPDWQEALNDRAVSALPIQSQQVISGKVI